MTQNSTSSDRRVEQEYRRTWRRQQSDSVATTLNYRGVTLIAIDRHPADRDLKLPGNFVIVALA
jgi:hypothetical protein